VNDHAQLQEDARLIEALAEAPLVHDWFGLACSDLDIVDPRRWG
jgi:hypothetical protein